MVEEISGAPQDQIVIDDSDRVMRWITKYGAEKRADGSFKKLRPGAFPLRPTDEHGFSMYLNKLMSVERCQAKGLQQNSDHIGIAILTAKDFRDFGLDVEQFTEHSEVAHCEVTKYQVKTEHELTDIKREWIRRTQNDFIPIAK